MVVTGVVLYQKVQPLFHLGSGCLANVCCILWTERWNVLFHWNNIKECGRLLEIAKVTVVECRWASERVSPQSRAFPCSHQQYPGGETTMTVPLGQQLQVACGTPWKVPNLMGRWICDPHLSLCVVWIPAFQWRITLHSDTFSPTPLNTFYFKASSFTCFILIFPMNSAY